MGLAPARPADQQDVLPRRLLLLRTGQHQRACESETSGGELFLYSNPRGDEGVILVGHCAAIKARFAATAGPVLVLHDTTEFSSHRDNPEVIGHLSLLKARHATVTPCGLLMHSSLVLTPGGVPLGLASVKSWTRKKFKGTNALRGRVNPTRIPIEHTESVRWLENLKGATALLAFPEAKLLAP